MPVRRRDCLQPLMLLVLLYACGVKTVPVTQEASQADVGDIEVDAEKDDLTFVTCNPNNIYQYYGVKTTYKGEAPAIRDHFFQQLRYTTEAPADNGYVTIRFVVNCKGQTGWFRVMQVNKNYERTVFNRDLVKQLAQLTRELKDWIPGQLGSTTVDSYYYLNFKIKEGKVIDITP